MLSVKVVYACNTDSFKVRICAYKEIIYQFPLLLYCIILQVLMVLRNVSFSRTVIIPRCSQAEYFKINYSLLSAGVKLPRILKHLSQGMLQN